jgi:ribonuclease HI
MSDRGLIKLFSDGACDPNPGPGGWAVILRSGAHEKRLSGGCRRTTNNRMELRAVIEGLKALKYPGLRVRVISDSQYVTNAVTHGWLERWAARHFKKAEGMRENSDLWIELLALLKKHGVTFEWIRGHAGHRENELCDALAVKARSGADLPVDIGFEQAEATSNSVSVRWPGAPPSVRKINLFSQE